MILKVNFERRYSVIQLCENIPVLCCFVRLNTNEQDVGYQNVITLIFLIKMCNKLKMKSPDIDKYFKTINYL